MVFSAMCCYIAQYIALILSAWRPSVCLPSMYRIVQQKVKMGTWQDRLVTWLRKATRIVVFCDFKFYSTKEDRWGMEKVEFCTSAASNSSHVALSQYLLSFLVTKLHGARFTLAASYIVSFIHYRVWLLRIMHFWRFPVLNRLFITVWKHTMFRQHVHN